VQFFNSAVVCEFAIILNQY